MGYSSRRPHWVPLLSDKNRKRRLQFAQAQNFGMWWNRRFASWMCSRQVCSNCVMPSFQYGPNSLRNVSNTLLNLCHKDKRQYWRQKWVQPGTSKVYQIKWPVSVVYIYIYIYIYIYHESSTVSFYIKRYIAQVDKSGVSVNIAGCISSFTMAV